MWIQDHLPDLLIELFHILFIPYIVGTGIVGNKQDLAQVIQELLKVDGRGCEGIIGQARVNPIVEGSPNGLQGRSSN